MQNVKCKMQNARCKMQDAKCKMQNAKCKIFIKEKKKGTKTDPKVSAKMRQSQPWNSI